MQSGVLTSTFTNLTMIERNIFCICRIVNSIKIDFFKNDFRLTNISVVGLKTTFTFNNLILHHNWYIYIYHAFLGIVERILFQLCVFRRSVFKKPHKESGNYVVIFKTGDIFIVVTTKRKFINARKNNYICNSLQVVSILFSFDLHWLLETQPYKFSCISTFDTRLS